MVPPHEEEVVYQWESAVDTRVMASLTLNRRVPTDCLHGTIICCGRANLWGACASFGNQYANNLGGVLISAFPYAQIDICEYGVIRVSFMNRSTVLQRMPYMLPAFVMRQG